MKSKYENKSIGDTEKLVCINECECPGLGTWKPGDVVTESKIVSYLINNPNFKRNTKEEK